MMRQNPPYINYNMTIRQSARQARNEGKMATRKLHVNLSANCRAPANRLPNISIYANVSHDKWNDRAGAFTERSEKDQINHPDWEQQDNHGFTFYNRRHNAFKDHARYDLMSRAFVKREGTFAKYYTTTYNASADPLFKEDNNRKIDRFFDMLGLLTFQPQNELYARFGIQYTSNLEMYLSMSLFLEYNYASLRREGIVPECSPDTHNPIWWQRGYEAFHYYGYSAAQIFPKSGDTMKFEFDNVAYTVSKVMDDLPDVQFKWRKYWWKLYLTPTLDNSRTVATDVLNHPEQEGFLNGLLGGGTVTTDNDGKVTSTPSYVFDTSATIDELKGDVLYRPPEVDSCIKDITSDPSYYACSSLLGQW